MSANSFRLLRQVQPSHYDIHLEPDLENLTFEARVGIDIEVTEPVDSLVLNAAQLKIKQASLTAGAGQVKVGDIVYDDELERVTLYLGQTARTGKYRLSIEYTGIINDQLRGLYRSVYRDAEGKEHLIATSQCQSTDARRIFPCWDEPDFKATFQTTMVVPGHLEAYANTGEVARRPLEEGRVEIRFAPTMTMSTYLLAFIVGPFQATDPVEVLGTPIRIIVPQGNLHLTQVALEYAQFCFEYLSDYYGISYPGDKLDHIAIPDFAAGAMENVGLITYRDAFLVIDREKASQAELQTSVDVIGHEIAHQWFGNLVTMAWWEGAWLNEAFATFMELKATDARHPEWKRWLAFANTEVPWAMETDQLSTTRPVEFEVNAPTDVDEMFDAITYGKGSAVLHMIEEFIGVDQFREGVGTYLRRHEYGNTVTSDLWAGLDGASEWPVGQIMTTWVHQPGFPQVEASIDAEGIELSQRRYLAIPDSEDQTRWKIPIQLRGMVDGEEFHHKVLLEEKRTVIPLAGEADWMVANGGGYGFYRTRYSDQIFLSLLDNLDRMSDVERYTLVSDTLAFVRSGQLSSGDFLDLIAGLGDETEQAIWSLMAKGLATIEHHALDDSVRPAFQGYVGGLVGPALERVGWTPAPGEADLDRKLRGVLIAALGNLGDDKATIDRARQVVDDLLGGGMPDPEVATAALAVYAHHGGEVEYDRLWSAYRGAATPLEQVRYLRAVTGVEVEGLAVATLNKIVQGDIRSQDGFWVFTGLLAGRAGPVVWENARDRWEEVLAVMPGLTRRRVVDGVPALSQPEMAVEVKTFFAENPIPEAPRALAQKLELLDANVAMRQRETPRVREYFS